MANQEYEMKEYERKQFSLENGSTLGTVSARRAIEFCAVVYAN